MTGPLSTTGPVGRRWANPGRFQRDGHGVARQGRQARLSRLVWPGRTRPNERGGRPGVIAQSSSATASQQRQVAHGLDGQ